jgi:hypothetical protein
MAQRDQIGSFFRRLNASDTRDRKDVAFGVAAVDDHLQGLRQHTNEGLGHGLAMGHGFIRDIDHVGTALGVEMSEHNEYSWASRGILPPMPG